MPRIMDDLILDHNLLRVLEHFRLAKVDYAKNVTRYTEINRSVVKRYLDRLEGQGLLEKYTNTSIKRTAAKLKKSAEVHKHHTYYRITRQGNIVLRDLNADRYLDHLGHECISALSSRSFREGHGRECLKLIDMGLLNKELERTDLGDEILRRANAKGLN